MLIFLVAVSPVMGFPAVAVVRIESFVEKRKNPRRLPGLAGLPLSRRGFNHYLIKALVAEVLLESYSVANNMPVEYTNIA